MINLYKNSEDTVTTKLALLSNVLFSDHCLLVELLNSYKLGISNDLGLSSIIKAITFNVKFVPKL